MSDEAAYKREIVECGGEAAMYRPYASVRTQKTRVTESSPESRNFSIDSLTRSKDEGRSRSKQRR
jgi:hypothetical protein